MDKNFVYFHVRQSQMKKNKSTHPSLKMPENIPGILLNTKGIVLSANKYFSKVYGKSQSEIIGKKLNEILRGKKSLSIAKISRLLTKQHYMSYHVQLQNGNIERSTFNAILFKKDRMLCCLFNQLEDTLKLMKEIEILNSIADHNLKKLIKSNEKLILARQSEKEAVQSKEKFLTNVSHELRTPLTGISGILQLLSKTTMDTTQTEYVSSLSHSAKNLISMINELLDLSKLKSGKFELISKEFSLEECINYTASSFSIISSNTNVHFSLTYDNKIPKTLIGDSLRISQILNNLLQNAFKFTSEGFVYLEIKLREKKGKNVSVEFSVTDSGSGIEKEKLSKIFDEFYQVETDAATRVGGTGLGLTICQQLVKLQGGTITVDSNPGKGTSFHVSLPFRMGKATRQKPEAGKKRMSHSSIMVVDDNPVNLLVMENVLKREGAEVVVCKNGKEALAAFEKKKAQAILVDLNMPVMGGFELAEKIRKISNVPMMAVTAENQDNLFEKCRNSGFMDVLYKPFSNENLISKSLNLLNVYSSDEKETTRGKKSQGQNENTPIDFNLIRSVSGGNNESFRELIQTIIENLKTDIPQLKLEIERTNFSSIKFFAHKLKTSYGYLNLKKEQNKLSIIEKNAEEKKGIKEIKKYFAIIINEHKKLIQSLKSVI